MQDFFHPCEHLAQDIDCSVCCGMPDIESPLTPSTGDTLMYISPGGVASYLEDKITRLEEVVGDEQVETQRSGLYCIFGELSDFLDIIREGTDVRERYAGRIRGIAAKVLDRYPSLHDPRGNLEIYARNAVYELLELS